MEMMSSGPANPNPDLACDGRSDLTGRCDPSHPMHCCHFSVTTWELHPNLTHVCLKCGKTRGKIVNVVTGKVRMFPMRMKVVDDGRKSIAL